MTHNSLLKNTLRTSWTAEIPGTSFKAVRQQEVGLSPATLLKIYKQCVWPIFEYGSFSTTTTSDNKISQIQQLQNKFIPLALHLPKYICTKLLHDSTGLPYVKDRLFSCATKTLDRIAQNPLVKVSISHNRLNPAWDRYAIICSPFWYSLSLVKVKFCTLTSTNIVTKHACQHNSFWRSWCDSSHVPLISLKLETFLWQFWHIFLAPLTWLFKAHFIASKWLSMTNRFLAILTSLSTEANILITLSKQTFPGLKNNHYY